MSWKVTRVNTISLYKSEYCCRLNVCYPRRPRIRYWREMDWASEEFETIDLGDKRLNKDAALLAERLVDSPSASIPKACRGGKRRRRRIVLSRMRR